MRFIVRFEPSHFPDDFYKKAYSQEEVKKIAAEAFPSPEQLKTLEEHGTLFVTQHPKAFHERTTRYLIMRMEGMFDKFKRDQVQESFVRVNALNPTLHLSSLMPDNDKEVGNELNGEEGRGRQQTRGGGPPMMRRRSPARGTQNAALHVGYWKKMMAEPQQTSDSWDQKPEAREAIRVMGLCIRKYFAKRVMSIQQKHDPDLFRRQLM